MKPQNIAAILAMSKPKKSAPIQKKVPAEAPEGPTKEQREHAVYVEQSIVDVTIKGRITIGKAHRRQARFETIEGLGSEQLKALRHYRRAFDESERSQTKSCLDVSEGGRGAGSHGAISRLEARAFGSAELRSIEKRFGPIGLRTLRDVALLDKTFSQVAMDRFGSRSVDYSVAGRGRRKPRSSVKLQPKSGAHREAIRREFLRAAARLVSVVSTNGR